MTDPAQSPKLPRLRNESPNPQAGRSIASIQTGALGHRSSFAEGMRNVPPSPRQRHPSLTHSAVQDLLNNPTHRKHSEAQFVGKDWRLIKCGELVGSEDVKFVEKTTAVEEATKLLIAQGPPNVILIREKESDTKAIDTFDYSDLNAYLLVVLGLAHPTTEEQVRTYTKIAENAREGTNIPLEDITDLAVKPPLVVLGESEALSKAIEIFAGGVHRILIMKEGSTQIIGILSQWRLVNFLWDNSSSFPVIDQLCTVQLKDLEIGSHRIIAINGDKPLTDALQLMHSESLTSLAVVDSAQNVIGNISTVDVRHLTNTSSLPLLKSSCIHFISVILSERGMENGADSFPVFYVNPYSTLAHTVAKLTATRSHRMWVVESASPSPSQPATPAATPAVLSFPTQHAPQSPKIGSTHPAVSANALPGKGISGRLTGVVSLTDVLNLFARQSGLVVGEPGSERNRRRRSSSISTRPSMDGARSSIDLRR